jgi:hypothetical protein
MQDQENATLTIRNRAPWNKGKLTGAKPPLRPKHVWCIRTKLQIEGRVRDLAMFNLVIDGKLRGCDVVAIKVENVAAGGYTADRATVRQKKTGRPVSSKNFDAPHQNQLRSSHAPCHLIFGNVADVLRHTDARGYGSRPSPGRRGRVTRHDAALCSPKARASFASTGATVSINRAAACSTESPAVSTTAAARA